MIKSLKFFAALAALFVSGAALSQAQIAAPKIVVVDMMKLLDEHYKTEEQKNKLQADAEKASEEADRLLADRNTLVEEYKEALEQSNNPATRAEVKDQAREQAELKLQEIQRKNNELQSFEANTRNLLQQRFQNFKTIMLEEISKIAIEVGKRKGATLVLDKSGPNLLGIATVVYHDESLDITAEVEAEINRDRPAGAAATSSSTTPSVTVPIGR